MAAFFVARMPFVTMATRKDQAAGFYDHGRLH